jgi:MFS family permease
MGLLVDKVSRKKLLCGAVIAFSMSTVISATTSSFAVMLLMRFFLGALVSATEPAGFSMLGDLFPRTVRTTANSIVGTGSYLGSGLASFLIMIVGSYGWRAAYAVKGGFGILIGLSALLVLREPERGML